MKSAQGKTWIWLICIVAFVLWESFIFPLFISLPTYGHPWRNVLGRTLPYFVFGIYLLVSGLRRFRPKWGRLVGSVLILLYAGHVTYALWQKGIGDENGMRCISNMKQLGAALLQYADDHEGYLPDAAKWVDAIDPDSKYPGLSHCPADRSRARSSYAMNANLSRKKVEEIKDPENTVLLYETSRPGDNPFGVGKDLLLNSRHRFNNFLFADGHIRFKGGHF